MFDNLLHNHALPTIGVDGQLTTRRTTCAEAEAHHAPHVSTALVEDGQGGTKLGLIVVNCHTAETERQGLLVANRDQAATIEAQDTRIETLKATVADYKRLMAGSMQIVFHMGPALQSLLAEDLADPNLTDDGTAVKVENVLFTVLIAPFEERITVRSVTGRVPERSFPVVNGRISEDDQTLMLGHVDRIKKADVDGVDPVKGSIGLVDKAALAA